MQTNSREPAFTLIETMIAVLLMALLTGTVVLGFSHSLNSARAQDAAEAIGSFDQMCRQAARVSGNPVRLVFDLSNNTLEQRDGADLATPRIHIGLPAVVRLDSVSAEGNATYSGEAILDISDHGWSKSYAVHMIGAGTDRWLVFAGMTGEMSQVSDESQLPTYSSATGHDAD